MSRKLKGSAIVDSSVTGTQIETALVNKITDAYNQANAAYGQANTGSTSGSDAYNQANAAYGQANAAYGQANNARSDANTTFATINTTFGTVNTSLGTVNTSLGTINTNYQAAYAQANTARDTANDAYGQANTGRTTANNAYASANLAYAAANNSNLQLGGLVSGTLNVTQDLIVGGNIYLEGNTTYINVATYSVEDSLIYMSSNNKLTDSVDIGFMGGKNTGGSYAHTGLARDATDGKWKLFDGLAEEGHVGNVVDFANTYLATLVANVEANSITVLGNAVATATNTAAAYTQANTARTTANDAYSQANSAYGAANTRVLKAGDTMTGNLTMTGTQPAIRLEESGGGSKRLQLSVNSGGVAFVSADQSSQQIAFTTVGTEAVRIDSSQRVGIGTTSPGNKLHVHQNSSNVVSKIGTDYRSGSSSNVFSTGLQILAQSVDNTSARSAAFIDFEVRNPGLNGSHGTSGFLVLTHGTGTSFGNGQFDFYIRNDTAPYSFNNDSSTTSDYWMSSLMTIKSDGTVGIGTTNPTRKLQVFTTGGDMASFVSANTGFVIQENSSGLDQVELVGYRDTDSSYNNILIRGSAVGLFVNGTTGNVGVGTTNPGAKLHIEGSGTASLFDINNTTAGKTVIRFRNNGSTVGLIGLSGAWKGDSSNDFILAAETGLGLRFYTNGSATEKIIIDTSGHVTPGANGTQNLGSTTARWATVFTSDLDLNNGVGDWTIVEGEDDLFIYNNKRGKVYKFKLEEVDPSSATPKKE